MSLAGAPEAGGDSRPIGILDSGVGGLSVLRHLQVLLPNEHLIYFADQAHIPYGSRSLEEIQTYTAGITRFLLARDAKLIVVACNTASGAALDHVRALFPETPIIGMEPAIKPAALLTATGKVGVLATPGTFTSSRYAALVGRFAQGISVYEDPCRGLVEQVERGALDAPETEAILRQAVGPMVEAGVDTIVLGCTHYPFVVPVLERVLGDDVAIIDPAPAVARHTRNVLQQKHRLAPETQLGSLRLLTTGDATRLSDLVRLLLDQSGPAETISWQGEQLVGAPAERPGGAAPRE